MRQHQGRFKPQLSNPQRVQQFEWDNDQTEHLNHPGTYCSSFHTNLRLGEKSDMISGFTSSDSRTQCSTTWSTNFKHKCCMERPILYSVAKEILIGGRIKRWWISFVLVPFVMGGTSSAYRIWSANSHDTLWISQFETPHASLHVLQPQTLQSTLKCAFRHVFATNCQYLILQKRTINFYFDLSSRTCLDR